VPEHMDLKAMKSLAVRFVSYEFRIAQRRHFVDGRGVELTRFP
jgi:hypothetical protein